MPTLKDCKRCRELLDEERQLNYEYIEGIKNILLYSINDLSHFPVELMMNNRTIFITVFRVGRGTPELAESLLRLIIGNFEIISSNELFEESLVFFINYCDEWYLRDKPIKRFLEKRVYSRKIHRCVIKDLCDTVKWYLKYPPHKRFLEYGKYRKARNNLPQQILDIIDE